MALVVTGLLCSPARALESAAWTTKRDTVTMVTDTDAVAAGAPLHAGLRLKLAPGWHTYWQNPGDAGLPPDIALALPPGATAGPIAWPAPQRVSEGPLTTFAYTGELLLPLTITPGQGDLPLRAHATWLVCSNICVPEEADLALDLPAGTPAPSAEASLFAAAAARTPISSPYPATVAANGTLRLQGAGLPEAVRRASFFPDAADAIDIGAEQRLTASNDTISLALHPAAGFRLDSGLSGLLVLQDAKGGETYLLVDAKPDDAKLVDAKLGPSAAAPTQVWQLVLLAMAGGLILNLMPCVFPVLAMKAIGIALLSGAARSEIRAHAASYCAGVVLAFAGLGGVLLALRSLAPSGAAAGWGFQFQSPVFVAAMAGLLFLTGLNLSGVFAVGGAAGVGQSLAGRRGHAGSFFTGLLAVLVATPCTAPFMGVAIAGALAAPASVTLLVFGAMGAGLALPYGVLAMAPGLARHLPRPGAWMDILKQVLAFPMYGAAVWLVWVVSQEAGSDGVLATLCGLLALGFAGWAWGQSQQRSNPGRRVAQGAALVGLLVAFGLAPGIVSAVPTTQAGADGVEPYSASRLAELRRDGRPVFVNMTAAWCVSCLVNERVALSPQPVQDAFKRNGVAYLKGDWTRQDPAISSFLRDNGRDGVPLYLYYAPGQPAVVLPQILTQRLVLDKIQRAAVGQTPTAANPS